VFISVQEAIELAQSMVATGELNGKRTIGLITRMDEPLGSAVGNWFEVYECVKIMRNEHDAHLSKSLVELTLTLAGQMCILGGKCETIEEGIDMARTNLENGKVSERTDEDEERRSGVINEQRFALLAK